MQRETKELTLYPVLNSKTSLDVKPYIPKRGQEAQELFYHRLAKGLAETDYMDKALDLRHIGKFFRLI